MPKKEYRIVLSKRRTQKDKNKKIHKKSKAIKDYYNKNFMTGYY
jgi:hypothetical protein